MSCTSSQAALHAAWNSLNHGVDTPVFGTGNDGSLSMPTAGPFAPFRESFSVHAGHDGETVVIREEQDQFLW